MIFHILFICIFVSSRLLGEEFESYNDYVSHYSFDQVEEIPAHFELKSSIDVTGQGKINSSPFKGEHIRFGEGQVCAYYTFPCYRATAISVGAGYSETAVIWKRNPFFRETHYNNFLLSLNAYSEAICDWIWQGGFSIAVDSDEWNWSDYALYTTTLWGRYNYQENLGIHIGFIEQSGIRKDRMFPIIGVDFTMWEDWKVNLVYPVNMSLVYNMTDELSIALAGRIFNSRHRVGENEPLPRGIFEYRNVGAELGLSYSPGVFANANVHVGSALGGDLKVTNKNNHNATHVKFNNTLYIGGLLEFKY